MAVVTAKDKNEALIPASVMRSARITLGDQVSDRLDASMEDGKIARILKFTVECGIGEGLDDLKWGRIYGPYASATAVKTAFDDRTRRRAAS